MTTINENKITTEDKLWFIIIIVANVALRFFDSTIPNLFVELAFFASLAILLLGFYFHLKKTYKNLKLLFILLYLITFVFPLIHFINYKIDAKNFNYSEDFLVYTNNEYKAELEKFKDCDSIQHFLNVTPKSSLNLTIDDSLIDKTYKIGDYNLKIVQNFNVRRPSSRHKIDKIIYIQNASKTIGSFFISDETIGEVINKKLAEREEILNMYKNLKSNLNYSSLYIDSLSGFVFSNFKPISSASQFIQFLQLIAFFFFLHAVSANLDVHGKFIIRKKSVTVES